MRIALAGDTMLGRGVAERIREHGVPGLFSAEVVALCREADLVALNLECCISSRGERWPDRRKPFFFRGPPEAIEALRTLSTSCVTLANNHAQDFGAVALLDTLAYLDAAGIAWVGAGPDGERARAPAVLEAGGERLVLIGVSDHPAAYAAGRDRPGIAYADLEAGPPAWLVDEIQRARARGDAVLVTPHWGPNMAASPVPYVRDAGRALVAAGASLVAGHSAHVFQGMEERTLWDLGDFIDDYAVDPLLRNDLGLLWLVTLEPEGPTRVEAVPLRLEYCHTRLAVGPDADWIRQRLVTACRPFGVTVAEEDGRLVMTSQPR